MKRTVVLCATAVLFALANLAAADAKGDVKAAAKKLADAANYSWKTTVAVPETARFKPGPTEGKAEKGGFTHLAFSFGENKTEVVIKGDKGAVKTQDGWKSFAEANEGDAQNNPARFMARMAQAFKAPAAQAEDLVSKAKELKSADNAITGELTEEGVKVLLTQGRGRGGNNPPEVKDPKGSVTFWIKDGALAKYEVKVQGTVTRNNNDVDISRTTTVEIKDVGSTKLEIPEEGKKKAE